MKAPFVNPGARVQSVENFTDLLNNVTLWLSKGRKQIFTFGNDNQGTNFLCFYGHSSQSYDGLILR